LNYNTYGFKAKVISFLKKILFLAFIFILGFISGIGILFSGIVDKPVTYISRFIDFNSVKDSKLSFSPIFTEVKTSHKELK